MGFVININLKWFHGISKLQKIYNHCWQQNVLNCTLTSKRDNLTFT